MKKFLILALSLTAVCCLSGCAEHAAALTAGTQSGANTVLPAYDKDGFEHKHFEGDNTIEDALYATCGNTVTKITRNTQTGGEPAERSFMYEDSVALTDLLLELDYSGDVCKCLPEYYVKTEFDQEPYEISLSGGYVRFNGGQVSLTAEQLELIQGIIGRHLK